MYYSKGNWVHRRGQDDEDIKSARIDLAQRLVDRDENINGRRGTLKNVKRDFASGEDDNIEAQSRDCGGEEKAVSVYFCLIYIYLYVLQNILQIRNTCIMFILLTRKEIDLMQFILI